MKNIQYATFETEYRVRPDDIDMYRHVHNSKYFDYVLAARYDQMKRCYGMPMEHFLAQGFGWLVRSVFVDYKRPLLLGDYFIISTGIESINEKNCRVKFSIKNKATNKVCCDGWFDFVMVTPAKRSPFLPTLLSTILLLSIKKRRSLSGDRRLNIIYKYGLIIFGVLFKVI